MESFRLLRVIRVQKARLSILIADPYQGIGLGGELVRRAMEVAGREGLQHLSAILTSDNQVMQHIFQKLGFRIEPTDRFTLRVSADAPFHHP